MMIGKVIPACLRSTASEENATPKQSIPKDERILDVSINPCP